MTRGVALGATSAFFLAAAFCAAVPKSFGQAAPAQPVAENSADSEEIIELDPFTVALLMNRLVTLSKIPWLARVFVPR